MHLSPDQVIYWQHGFFKLNSTILTTWVLMLLLTVAALLMTRGLSTGLEISRWQNFLEIIVGGIRDQIGEVGLPRPERFVGFIGTLFVFIATANLCTVFPWYEPPTGSLSTTAALALFTFFAVPFYGIAERGLRGYLKTYLEPTLLMLPFNIISELSRTLALAVRLFGNIMSGTMILAILMSVVPLFFPVLITALGLLTGLVQAYIFGVLASVYTAAAIRSGEEKVSSASNPEPTHE